MLRQQQLNEERRLLIDEHRFWSSFAENANKELATANNPRSFSAALVVSDIQQDRQVLQRPKEATCEWMIIKLHLFHLPIQLSSLKEHHTILRKFRTSDKARNREVRKCA